VYNRILIINMNSGSVSILIPSKNRNDYLVKALDSIVLQNYPGLRIYVVDNNDDENLSTEIKNLIATFQKENTSLDWTYLHSTKKNSAGVKNDGMALVETKYLCFLDDDDELCANSISKRIKEMQADDELALLYCGGYSKIYRYPIKMYRYYHHSPHGDHEELKMMSCSSMIINLDIFRKEGIKFEEALDRLEDYDLGKQLISKGLKIKSIPEPLVLIHQHPRERMSTYNPVTMEFKDVLIKKWAGTTHEYIYQYIAGLFLWRQCFGIEKKTYEDIVRILKTDFNRKPSVRFKCQFLLASFSPLAYLTLYHCLLVFWQLRYNNRQRKIA
jgi:glycosyltransferase involved in cell wall biosynthesis